MCVYYQLRKFVRQLLSFQYDFGYAGGLDNDDMPPNPTFVISKTLSTCDDVKQKG